MTWTMRSDLNAMGTAATRVHDVSGIPTSHIEKDYWVTETLRSVAAHSTAESTTIVFKGGTSLSKAHRLISRFSEDIDLLVITPTESKGAADRCLRAIASAVETAIDVEGEVDPQSATKGQKRTVTFNYPEQR